MTPMPSALKSKCDVHGETELYVSCIECVKESYKKAKKEGQVEIIDELKSKLKIAYKQNASLSEFDKGFNGCVDWILKLLNGEKK